MDKIQEILRPDLRATVGKPKAPPSKELSLKKSCNFYIKDLPENSPVVIPSKSDNCTTNLDDSCETAPESKEDIPDGQNKVNLDGQNSVVDIHTKIALKGDKIKDKVTGEVFIVESFAKGRYHCIDGKYRLSIPFDDAIAA
jgi:hypothetical protein